MKCHENSRKIFNLKNLSSLFFYLSIIIFIIAFNFADNPPGGWYQQTLPNLNGRTISDILFTDSLKGYATGYSNNNPNYILKTTDGGDNWFIVDSLVSWLTQLQFLNENTGYAGGAKLYKTTNQGYNWIQISMPMSVGGPSFSVHGHGSLQQDLKILTGYTCSTATSASYQNST